MYVRGKYAPVCVCIRAMSVQRSLKRPPGRRVEGGEWRVEKKERKEKGGALGHLSTRKRSMNGLLSVPYVRSCATGFIFAHVCAMVKDGRWMDAAFRGLLICP